MHINEKKHIVHNGVLNGHGIKNKIKSIPRTKCGTITTELNKPIKNQITKVTIIQQGSWRSSNV